MQAKIEQVVSEAFKQLGNTNPSEQQVSDAQQIVRNMTKHGKLPSSQAVASAIAKGGDGTDHLHTQELQPQPAAVVAQQELPIEASTGADESDFIDEDPTDDTDAEDDEDYEDDDQA